MAAAPAVFERIDLPPPPMPMERSPSRSASDVASDSSSRADTPDRNYQSNSSQPNPNRDFDFQSPASLRSEEYRQLFRLPSDEVLLQDFNCALQESILLQGHLYVFMHYICFYSNIFGFETKKIIPFDEITSIKRAKTAAIFPNAIEIFAGGKRYFFGSFLSRDEAFKLLHDVWLQNGGSKPNSDHQESTSDSNSQENGPVIEKVDSFKEISGLDSNDRQKDATHSDDAEVSPQVENDTASVLNAQVEVNAEQDVEPFCATASSSSTKSSTWNVENSDAPEISQSFTRVAESKFPIKVEEFFDLFFSDDATEFIESFHKRCGDKEFSCSSWYIHEKFGHARDVSFQHPIKIYFGAKCGSCRETLKFRVYRDRHLVIETSQAIDDVPYGDYFTVEGLWDVIKDGENSDEGCILRIYVGVAFSKKTVFKGKIVQSTSEECREAYAIWIDMAHEMLKQKNLEKRQEEPPAANVLQNGELQTATQVNAGSTSERSNRSSNHLRIPQTTVSDDATEHGGNHVEGNFMNATSIASAVGEYVMKFCSVLKSQSQTSLILVIAFSVIFLMQVSILVLLNRPQTIHVASPGDYYGGVGSIPGDRSAKAVAWWERRMHHLKDEMLMVEAWLERLRHEHTWLKTQLKDLENLRKHKKQ